MTRGMYRWAQLQAQTGDSSAYLYFFSHVPPEEGLEKFGAYHGAEVMYAFDNLGADSDADYKIGRASCRERGCQYVSISVVAVSLKKKNLKTYQQLTHQ